MVKERSSLRPPELQPERNIRGYLQFIRDLNSKFLIKEYSHHEEWMTLDSRLRNIEKMKPKELESLLQSIDNAILKLRPRDQSLLKLRFSLEDPDGSKVSYAEIGRSQEVAGATINKMVDRSMWKIRHMDRKEVGGFILF